MRKLVTIQKIREVCPIENADAIEVVRVLGWSVVIKKGEFKLGDSVVYAEIDSLLPDREEFEFLRERKFRVKTIKLRGQISQGICFPMSILPEGEYAEDDEVTEILGVKKYEPPIPACLDGQMKGYMPAFIQKTDETRIQILQHKLTEYKGTRCVYTEKLDGTSTSYYLRDGEFGVCTRELDLLEDDRNTLWQNARKLDLENKLRMLGRNLAIQGETIGDGIQSNKYNLGQNVRKFYVFNIFDINKYCYLGYEELIEIVNILGLEIVPVLDIDFELIDDIDKLVELSKGLSVLNPKVKREGIVIKSYVEVNDINIGRVSFKVINPEFSLKYND